MPAGRALKNNLFNARTRAKKRYFALRRWQLSDESILRVLASYEADIFDSGAMARNREKWPTARSAEDMVTLKQSVLQRIAYMDKALSAF